MIERLVSDLRRQGGRIRLKGDRIVCDAPPGVMTENLMEQLREHKDEIVELLSKEAAAAREFVIPSVSAHNGNTAVVCAGKPMVLRSS